MKIDNAGENVLLIINISKVFSMTEGNHAIRLKRGKWVFDAGGINNQK